VVRYQEKAEGHDREIQRFNGMAKVHGALAELETHCILAQQLNHIAAPALEIILNKTSEIGKMLNGLISSLRSKL
jgi:four helix bundle protein